MRWLLVSSLVLASCHNGPARDPADVSRIAALEQQVATLEAQLQKATARLDAARREREAEARLIPPAPAAGAAVAPPVPPRRGNPDPATTYNVPLDDSPGLGPAVAPITLVASVQFPEPFTHRVMATLMQLLTDYKRDLRIVVKLHIVHPRMTLSSLAACASAYQGALEPMEIAIWDAANDQSMNPPGAPGGMRGLDEVELRELARGLRLNLRQYDDDFAACKAGLARDTPVLTKLGQRGVPHFWVNGRPLSGAMPIAQFKKVIDEELDIYKADKASGGKLNTYYERLTKNAPTAP
jgi:protein-disulfide isomerase